MASDWFVRLHGIMGFLKVKTGPLVIQGDRKHVPGWMGFQSTHIGTHTLEVPTLC